VYSRRDEDGTEEGSSDRLVKKSLRQELRLALPSSRIAFKTAPDYEDVD
jgi:hypothetical protein